MKKEEEWHGKGLMSSRIIQENIILRLQSVDTHKCGLDICRNWD